MLAQFEQNAEKEHRKPRRDPAPPELKSNHRQKSQQKVGAKMQDFVVDVQPPNRAH